MQNQKSTLFGIIFLFPFFIQSGDNLAQSFGVVEKKSKRCPNLAASQPIPIPHNNNRNLISESPLSKSPSSPSLGNKGFHALFTEHKNTHDLNAIRVSPNYGVNEDTFSPVSLVAAAALMNSSPDGNQLRKSQK